MKWGRWNEMVPKRNRNLHKGMKGTENGNYTGRYDIFLISSLYLYIYIKDNCLNKNDNDEL